MAFMRCPYCECRIEDLCQDEWDFANLGIVLEEHVAADHPGKPVPREGSE